MLIYIYIYMFILYNRLCTQLQRPSGRLYPENIQKHYTFYKHDTFLHFSFSTEQKHTKTKNTQKHYVFDFTQKTRKITTLFNISPFFVYLKQSFAPNCDEQIYQLPQETMRFIQNRLRVNL